MSPGFHGRDASNTRWRTASVSAPRTPRSCSEMSGKFARRSRESELMDDLSRPDSEFDQAYRELEVINRRLGGIRAIERFLPDQSDLLLLDVAGGGCDVSEALLERRSTRIVTLDINPKGFKFARKSWPVAGDAMDLPF